MKKKKKHNSECQNSWGGGTNNYLSMQFFSSKNTPKSSKKKQPPKKLKIKSKKNTLPKNPPLQTKNHKKKFWKCSKTCKNLKNNQKNQIYPAVHIVGVSRERFHGCGQLVYLPGQRSLDSSSLVNTQVQLWRHVTCNT